MSLVANILQGQNNKLKETIIQLLPTAASLYVVGGDTLDLTAIKNPNALSDPFFARLPIVVGILNEEMSGGYIGIVPGLTLATYKVKFYAPGGTEQTAVTYNTMTGFATWNIVLDIIGLGGVS
jgi:hypothetical protein